MTAHPLLRIILSIDPDDVRPGYDVVTADLSIGEPLPGIHSRDVIGALHALCHGGLPLHMARSWGESDLEIPTLPDDACLADREAFAAAALMAVGEVLQEAGILPDNAHIVGLAKMGTHSDN